MLRKLTLLAIVPSEREPTIGCTAYFLNKDTNILLPIDLPADAIKPLVLASNPITRQEPPIHKTLKHLVTNLHGKLTGIKIHLYEEGIYHTHLRIKTKNSLFSITISFLDALCLAIAEKCSITIEHTILQNHGLPITEKLLEEALIQNRV